MTEERHFELIYEGSRASRLDVFLSNALEEGFSRSRIQGLIRDGQVRINQRVVDKPGTRLRPSDRVILHVPDTRPLDLVPEDVSFDIIYEDPDLAVIDKPAGLVVHPAPGNLRGTLVHGLINRLRDLSGVGGRMRPGIVHRLDKGTSGIMLVAKTDRAHLCLSDQLKNSVIRKEYLAIAHLRTAELDGMVDAPIARDRIHRKRMRVDYERGRPAITQYTCLAREGNVGLLSVKIKTGRTHQIRVHLSHKGIRILGDEVYGISPSVSMRQREVMGIGCLVYRPMLHSHKIGFSHPTSSKWMEFKANVPKDMSCLIEKLLGLKASAL